MNRLYNEYGAAPLIGIADEIDTIISNTFQEIWDMAVVEGDVCPRDLELFCQSTLGSLFAEKIFRRATEIRCKERKRIKMKGVCQC